MSCCRSPRPSSRPVRRTGGRRLRNSVTHKIICLAETGYQNVPDSTWFTTKLMPVADKYPISYLLLWRNAWDKPKENFGPAPGKSCVADFLKFYKAKKTLFIKDIKDIKDIK